MNNKSDILQELKGISPSLYDLKQADHRSFSVPDQYFNTLKEELYTSIELGFADNIGKQSFAVPDSYFDGLSNNIMSVIEAEEEKQENLVVQKGRVVEIHSSRNRKRINPFRIYAMVAAIAGLALFMTFLSNYFDDSGPANSFAEDVIEYIEDNYEAFESDELFALIDVTEVPMGLGTPSEFSEDVEEYIEEHIDDIEEYLLTNEI